MRILAALTVVALIARASVGHGAMYDLTTIAFSERGGVFPGGINDAGNVSGWACRYSCFNFLWFPDGSSELLDNRTSLTFAGINNLGQVAAETYQQGVGRGGAIRNADGTLDVLDIPTGRFDGVQIRDINDAGDVLGQRYLDGDDRPTMFLRRANGTIQDLETPNVEQFPAVHALRINNSGQVAGLYGQDSPYKSFILDTRDGAFRTVHYPGAFNTRIASINNNGDVLGRALVGVEKINFIQRANGRFIDIEFPLESVTLIDFNDRDQILGTYYVGDRTNHGFVASPVPEPSSFALLGVAIFGALVAYRRVQPQQR